MSWSIQPLFDELVQLGESRGISQHWHTLKYCKKHLKNDVVVIK